VSVELFLSHILTPLSQLLLHSSFLPLLKYVITKVLPVVLMGSPSTSDWSLLEPAGTGKNFWCLLTGATTAAPLLPNPCYINQDTFGLCNTLCWSSTVYHISAYKKRNVFS